MDTMWRHREGNLRSQGMVEMPSRTDRANNPIMPPSSVLENIGSSPLITNVATNGLTPTDRAILWEIDMARGCVANFNKLLGAHSIILSLLVTVNLIGFLQPPKGWAVNDYSGPGSDRNTTTMYMESGSVRAFAVTNSLSLYSGISGLLFYIYCSYGGFLSLDSISFPADMIYDEQGIDLLHNFRACLRCVVLPSLRRRITLLFGFLTCSLVFSGMAFVSAGLAAVGHNRRMAYVGVPAIIGCIPVLCFLVLVLVKHYHEIKFDDRFDVFWKEIAGIDKMPELRTVKSTTCRALDPVPLIPRCMCTGKSNEEGIVTNGSRNPSVNDMDPYFVYAHYENRNRQSQSSNLSNPQYRPYQ